MVKLSAGHPIGTQRSWSEAVSLSLPTSYVRAIPAVSRGFVSSVVSVGDPQAMHYWQRGLMGFRTRSDDLLWSSARRFGLIGCCTSLRCTRPRPEAMQLPAARRQRIPPDLLLAFVVDPLHRYRAVARGK